MPPKPLQVFSDAADARLPSSCKIKMHAPRDAHSWMAAIVHCAETHSQEELFKLLRGNSGRKNDQTVKIVNQTRTWVGKVFSFTPGSDSFQLATTTQYLYQRVLYRLLSMAMMEQAHLLHRTLNPAEQQSVVDAFLSRDDLQIGLINACVEVVNYCNMEEDNALDEAFPAMTLQMGRLRHGLELWRGLEWILKILYPASEDGVPGLPESVQGYMESIQVRILEELAWMDGSSLLKRFVAAGSGFSVEKGMKQVRTKGGSTLDQQLMSAFFRCLGRMCMERVGQLCAALSGCEELQDPHTMASFTYRAALITDTLVTENIWVLFNQHLTALILSCIYYTADLHNIKGIKMRKLTAIAQELLDCHDETTFQQLDLNGHKNGPEGNGMEAAVDVARRVNNHDAWWDDGDDGENDEDHPAPMVLGNMKEYYKFVVFPLLEEYTPEDFFGDGYNPHLDKSPAPTDMHSIHDQMMDKMNLDEGNVNVSSQGTIRRPSSAGLHVYFSSKDKDKDRRSPPRGLHPRSKSPMKVGSPGKDKAKRKPLGSLLKNTAYF